MNISSTNVSSELLTQLQNTQRKETPSSSDFATAIMEASDTNDDNALDISEVNISEELFSSLDSNSDGSLNAEELTTGISSKLQEVEYNTSTPEEFGEFLTQLGLDVPKPPQRDMPNVSNISSQIFNDNDTDEDGLLSISELDISSELFSSIDSDEDGQISKNELEEKLTSMFEDLNNEEITSSEFQETMTALGAVPPQQGAGGQMAGGGGGGSSSQEEYDEADTNEDGVVSAAEYAAYYGTDESAQTENREQYTKDLISTFVSTLKEEANENGTELELSQFKDIMKMVNNQIEDSTMASQLNQYVASIE